MARLQSHVWVAAFIRAENAAGAHAVVGRRGAAEAGAIFVAQEHADGTVTVFSPAPQTMASPQAGMGGRAFERVLERAPSAAAREWLEKQIRFDGDCWIVETDRRDGDPLFV